MLTYAKKRIESLKGIGQKKTGLLHELGIYNVDDILFHYPASYEDRSKLVPIAELKENQSCYISGVVVEIKKNHTYKHSSSMVRVVIEDDTGRLDVVFFNAGFYANSIIKGQQYNFYGKISRGKYGLQMVHPEFEKSTSTFKSMILPVYSTVKGISQKELRKIAAFALNDDEYTKETLPAYVVEENRLCNRKFALENIHFPGDKKAFAVAKYRIIFEELFFMQAGLFMRGNARCRSSCGIAYPHDNSIKEFASMLGFEMTGAQKRVMNEIVMDMESDIPMQRLVQGDVGSGKTAIAAAALYKAAKNGWQGVLMAPTELLARQHYESFMELFASTDIKIGFLSSGVKGNEKKTLLSDIANGSIDIVIGTHAVIQESVHFARLGLVITDEQHRFGVNQRINLAAKGQNPDILVMTATPIPRTLAVIIYGDLDISIIDEMPPGRIPIKTKAVSLKSRKKIYAFAADMIKQGRQVYAVAPLIEDSDSMDIMSAESLYKKLCLDYPELSIGMVYGSMSQAQKDYEMERFVEHKTDLLVATVVIEVGINVPNATVMIIENAERFGLAQLHQLRGRVGRGKHQSYCFLITDEGSGLGIKRAKIIEENCDGFEIAEKDLQLRGPGDFFGTRQHGLPSLNMADMAKHIGILNNLRPGVKEILQKDPQLKKEENTLIAAGVERLFGSLENLGI